MSSRPSQDPSPSSSPKPAPSRNTSPEPESSNQQYAAPTHGLYDFAVIPSSASDSNSAAPVAPQIVITTESPQQTQVTEEPQAREPGCRQGRSLVSRHHRLRTSFSQPPGRITSPYERPRHQSQPRSIARVSTAAMSSASSSPGNTSTSGPSGSTSGSTPGYQLPYAPFPYPIPATARGSGQGQQSGRGSGK